MENNSEEFKFDIDDPRYYIVLESVFSYLTFDELINCELVCKKWKSISRKVNAKREYDFYLELYKIYNYTTDSWVSIDTFSRFLSKVPNLKGFCIDSLFPNLDYFKHHLELCPRFDKFQFWDYDYVEGLDYTELGKLLNSRAKKLMVHYMRRFDLFNLMVAQMDQVEYFAGHWLDDYNFLYNFKSLKSLDLDWITNYEICLSIVDGLINSGINEKLIHIKFYTVEDDEDNELSKRICSKLGKYFPQLESLSIYHIKLFWPKKLNLLELKEFDFLGHSFKFSMFNDNQLFNMESLSLDFNDEVLITNIDEMSKVFPNLKKLRLKFGIPNHFDDQSKMNTLKRFCNEISNLNHLQILKIDFFVNTATFPISNSINLEDEIFCKEIISLVKRMDNLNKIYLHQYKTINDEIMEMIIELAKCQPKKWILFPDHFQWITTKFTNDDLPRNLIVKIYETDPYASAEEENENNEAN